MKFRFFLCILAIFFVSCRHYHTVETAPIAPTISSAVNSTSAVTLTWNNVPTAYQYDVYLSEDANGSFLKTGQTPTTSYKIDGLINGTAYFFRVKAINAVGESPFSPKITAVPNPRIVSPYVFKNGSYKGEIHDHTTNSDGQQTPDQVAAAYKNAGYDFMAITDHNYLTTLTTDPGLLLIPGVEETANEGHIITLNPPSQVDSYDGQTIIDNSRYHGGIAILAHPNYVSAGYTLDELNTLTGYTAIEIYNRIVDYSEGHGNAEDKWDAILSEGKIIYGTAVDDEHVLNNLDFNLGWIVVFADSLTIDEIMNNIKAGNFYPTTGPNLDINLSDKVITATTDANSTIEFIVAQGVVRQTTGSVASATYTITGDEGYIRVRITRDSDSKKAWSNPIFIY